MRVAVAVFYHIITCVRRPRSQEERPWSWTLSSHRRGVRFWRPMSAGGERLTAKSAAITPFIWLWPGGTTLYGHCPKVYFINQHYCSLMQYTAGEQGTKKTTIFITIVPQLIGYIKNCKHFYYKFSKCCLNIQMRHSFMKFV